MSDIGHAAGLSRGAPAYFFASKQGVYLAVIRRGLQRISAAIDTTARSLGPDLGSTQTELVTELVFAHLAVMSSERDMLRILQRDALDGWTAMRQVAQEAEGLLRDIERLWSEALHLPPDRAGRAASVALAVASLPWTAPGRDEGLFDASGVNPLRAYASWVATMISGAL
jgi:AcrR family transcriptional regulator